MPAAAEYSASFADRDAHAPGALVTQAQDPLVVRDDDQADLVTGRVPEDLGMRCTSSGVIQTPPAVRYWWLNSWHARPTDGVYTIGRSSSSCR